MKGVWGGGGSPCTDSTPIGGEADSRVFVLPGAEEDHGLEGIPVLQHTLQGQLGEARRLQVVVWHVRV